MSCIKLSGIFLIFFIIFSSAGCAGRTSKNYFKYADNQLSNCSELYLKEKYSRVLETGEALITEIQDTPIIPNDASAMRSLTAEIGNADSVGDKLFFTFITVVPTSWVFYLGDAIDSVSEKESKEDKQEVANRNYNPIDSLFTKLQQIKLYKMMGRSAYKTANYHKASIYLKKAIDLENNFRITIADEKMRQGYNHNFQDDMDRLIHSLYLDKNYDVMLQYMEYSKAKTTSELLLSKASRKYRKDTINPIQFAQAQIEVANEKPTLTRFDIKDLNRSIKVIYKDFRSTYPSKILTGSLSVTPIAAARYKSLPANTACLAYYISDNFLISALVIGGKVTSQNFTDLSNLDLNNKIKEYCILARNNNYSEFTLKSNELRKLLFDHYESSLAEQNIEHIIISPHKALHHFPFSGLYSRNTDKFTIDDFSISYIYSLNLLHILTEENQKESWSTENHSISIFGDPHNKILNTPRLSGAAFEARSIYKSLPAYSSEIYLSSAATESRALDKFESSTIVHLAAHSVFDEKNGENSFIILADDKQNDGILHAHELYRINRKDPLELAVLSSCESGATQQTSGDDHTGLARSFITLGTKRIVSTFWPISDESTVDIMTSFYKNLFQNKHAPHQSLNSSLQDARYYIRPDGNERDLTWIAFKIEGLPW